MRTPAGYVEIALNWDEYFDDEANVSTDESGKNVKKCALLYFYSVETGASVFDGPKESVSEYDDRTLSWTPHMFKGVLPEGTYHVVVMNRNFTNAHLLYDDKFEDARIDIAKDDGESVSFGKTRVAKAGDLICAPASVFLASGLDGDTKTLTVGNLDTVKRVASPKHMIKRVTFTITLEDFSASACRGVLGGVSASLKCSTCQCLPVSGRVKFQTEADATNPNVFKASFNVFDLIPAGAQSHLLELTLTIDGSERTTTVDISDDVLKELEKGDFTYDLPLALHIKVTHTIEGDIQASVEGWDDSGSGSGTGSY